MKKLQLSFVFLILFSLSSIYSIAQEFKYSDLATWKQEDITFGFTSYLSKDGAVYKIGDMLKIGAPSTNKTFAFITLPSGTVGISASGDNTEIKKIYVKGNNITGCRVAFKTKGIDWTSTYIIDIENAIALGEIKSSGMTSDEALTALKKSKDKLDLGLINQQKYDSIKIELVKYIK